MWQVISEINFSSVSIVEYIDMESHRNFTLFLTVILRNDCSTSYRHNLLNESTTNFQIFRGW